jgi:endonuclease/exonuclease/phosphatase family metal-dependent hydrolase
MWRMLKWTGGGLLALAVLLVGFVSWASTGRLTSEEMAQTHRYNADTAASLPDTLRVATYNIGYLSGLTNNEPVVRPESLFVANMDQAARLLRRADAHVVGTQEIDFGAARSYGVPQLDTLATRLGSAHAAQAVNWDERYLPFPYGRPAVHFGRVVSGQAVLSRAPIRQHVRHVLRRPPLPFYRAPFYLDRLAQIVLLDLGGTPLVVINVHLEAFNAETRYQQARAVRRLYERVTRGTTVPVLVLGDFNSQATRTDGTLRADSTMQILLHNTDLRLAAPPDSARATYPADRPTRRIDHILYREGFFRPARTTVACGPTAHPPSDHCAVTAALTPTDTLRTAAQPSAVTLPTHSR